MSTTCINCQEAVSAHYCPNCGQRNGVKRISFRQLYDDLQSKLFGLDLRFFITLRHLITSPQEVIQSYLAGNRVRFSPPFAYFLLIVSVWLLLFPLLNIDLKEMMSATFEAQMGESSEPATEAQEEIAQLILQSISSNMRIFSFFFVPFMALFRLIFFPKMGLNYLESMVIFLYLFGTTHLFNTLEAVLYAVGGYQFNLTANIMVLAYLTYGFVKFKKPKRLLPGILLTILMYLSSFIAFMIVGGIASAVIVIIRLQQA